VRGTTHFSAGAAIGTLVGALAGHPVAGLITGAAAGLVPDVDYPGSLIGKYVRPLAVYLEEKAGHREITHTLLFCIPAGFVLGLLAGVITGSLTLILAGILGTISHLVLDAMTKTGIRPFLYLPVGKLKQKHYKGGVITGKDYREHIITIASWIAVILVYIRII